jgi:hypothetical protein
MAEPRFMSSQETARYVGVAPQTLANWRYLGRGPRFYRVGQLVKYDLRDVDSWLEQHADEPAPAA